MLELPITAVTAAVAGIILVVLGVTAGGQRGKSKISLGTGDDEILLRKVRAHGNFTEYTPIALILLALAEMAGTNHALLWAVSGLLIVGRILHAIGLIGSVMPCRVVGMLMTVASVLLGAGILLWP